MPPDLGEMTAAVGTNHVRLSNQSYGWIAGWYYVAATPGTGMAIRTSAAPKSPFGNYTTNASTFDNLIQGAPAYLQVWAAGNDQGEAPPVQPTNHVERTGATTTYRPPDGDQGGYDTMSEQACAKNVLTVGAIYPLANG